MVQPASFDKLTWKIVKDYVGRKRQNVVAIFCDTKTHKIYPIPHDIEHDDFAALLLGVKIENIIATPQIAAHLVPVTILLNNAHDEVIGIFTGTSGLELGPCKVRHVMKQLTTAQIMAQAFVFTGEIPVTKDKSFVMPIKERS